MPIEAPTGRVNPCGLNCAWCVYGKMEASQGCPGCEGRQDCLIRACAERRGQTCDQCPSMPCYPFLQGYQCMKEHYVY